MSACLAIVRVGDGDNAYGCDVSYPHPGVAHHADTPLGRIDWCSHGEVKGAKK